jgi:hypothetical protein
MQMFFYHCLLVHVSGEAMKYRLTKYEINILEDSVGGDFEILCATCNHPHGKHEYKFPCACTEEDCFCLSFNQRRYYWSLFKEKLT